MKFRCIKEVPSCVGLDFEKMNKIPVGEICDVAEFERLPAIFYKGVAICDVDSPMAKDYFVEVEE